MTVMIEEVRKALVAAGASDELAEQAAAAVLPRAEALTREDFHRLTSDMKDGLARLELKMETTASRLDVRMETSLRQISERLDAGFRHLTGELSDAKSQLATLQTDVAWIKRLLYSLPGVLVLIAWIAIRQGWL
jgi:hypothetical protein